MTTKTEGAPSLREYAERSEAQRLPPLERWLTVLGLLEEVREAFLPRNGQRPLTVAKVRSYLAKHHGYDAVWGSMQPLYVLRERWLHDRRTD